MSRFTSKGRLSTTLAAVASLTLAACSDTVVPVQPDASGPAPSSPSLSKSQAVDDVVPGEVLVKLRSGAPVTIASLASKHGAILGRIGVGAAFQVLQTARGNERVMAALLAADPTVEYAEPNYIRHVDAIDARLWAFRNPGGLNMSFFNDPSGRTGPLPSSYASISDADEDNIESYAAGGANVTIGSIDTGVDFAHPEFTGRLIAGKDWYSNDNDPSDTPDEGHGTHTTGTMAGSSIGVAGVSGAAPHVKVYVQRVCGPNGCPTSAIVNAINAAASYLDAGGKHLVAVNMSLGGTSESTAEKNAIQNATNQGVLVIASAGNSGSGTVACPACDPNAISVSSTTWRDELATYSQYGSGLDISAPGGTCYSNTTEEGCIFSSVVAGYQGGRLYNGPLASNRYAYMQGTSMAAPQVTGTAAIVASKLGLRGSALRSRLYSTADDKGTAGYDTKFGNGRVNAYRAVTGSTLAGTQ
ncbi:MAG TPA: S8 family serine peptidase [Gemmatimonadaceae bacterium]|jgi:subtilisin family serine protease|nr:S8 family serine peptidase [Gemmatimonadaceae bacterium]